MLNNIAAIFGGATEVGDYESIATTTLGSSTATITFSSIPATYKHLQVRGIMRNDVAITGMGDLRVRFNSDSGSNYTYHILYGDGTSAAAGAATSQTYGRLARNVTPCANNGANIFGAFVADILDYANSNKNKTIRSIGGENNNTTTASAQSISFTSSAWLSTSAITQIDITDDSSGNFVQYSSFALYGIK
jgi:hypothetical protein